MESIQVGMVVRSLDDRTIGHVCKVHGCCFRFDVRDSSERLSSTPEAVFDVQFGVLTLIYVAGEPHRYQCPSHPPLVSAPPIVRIGWGAAPASLGFQPIRPTGTAIGSRGRDLAATR